MNLNGFQLFETWYEEGIKYNKIYAKINGKYYLPVNDPIKEEVLLYEGIQVEDQVFCIFNFYFCRLNKKKNGIVKETRLSPNYILSDDIVRSSEIGRFDCEGDDFLMCKKILTDSEGNQSTFYTTIYDGDQPIENPKRLLLEN